MNMHNVLHRYLLYENVYILDIVIAFTCYFSVTIRLKVNLCTGDIVCACDALACEHNILSSNSYLGTLNYFSL